MSSYILSTVWVLLTLFLLSYGRYNKSNEISNVMFHNKNVSSLVSSAPRATVSTNNTRNTSSINQVIIYKQMLKRKRQEQLSAVKAILKHYDHGKQQKVVQTLLEKLHEVMVTSKLVLENKLYNAEDPFPEEDDVRDALSLILENTAFFGDILLHLPDITHELLDKHKTWLDLFHWSIRFANSTDLYDAKTMEMINLAAQELNLVERNPNYVNPYKKIPLKVELPVPPNPKPTEKKKRQKVKGPRLTRQEL